MVFGRDATKRWVQSLKILYTDIEWKPATAYVWKMWDENISPSQLIDEGGLLCFSWTWDGKEYGFASEWEEGKEGMAKIALELLSQADAVVTYNGDRYDLPKLMGEILLAGLKPPPPPTSIDLIKTVKKMGYVMNRLAYIGPLLGVGKKVKHEGFELWRAVLEGNQKARQRMRRYCIRDVKLLVNLYARVKPFIKNHPHLGKDKQECGACGSRETQRRGYRRTKAFLIQRLQCKKCGSWSDGTRTKVK